MTNFQFLEKYLQLSYGGEPDKLIKLPFATIKLTNSNKSKFENLALIEKELSAEELIEIEKYFDEADRTPSLYFESQKNFEFNNYRKKWEDSWMFYNGTEVDQANFDKIKIVKDEKELETFLNIFDKSYQKDDPQNPYGDVKDFLPDTKTGWYKHHEGGRLKYFSAYKNEEPVATALLHSFEGLGYIACVGSLQSVRGEGFGKLATLYAVNESIKMGNTEHCLATEEGTYPNEFYKRIGFETKFTAVGLSKKAAA